MHKVRLPIALSGTHPKPHGILASALSMPTTFTIEEFYAMNPTVKSDCSGLLNLGTYYCISTIRGGLPAGFAPSSNTTESAASTGIATATPVPSETSDRDSSKTMKSV